MRICKRDNHLSCFFKTKNKVLVLIWYYCNFGSFKNYILSVIVSFIRLCKRKFSIVIYF